MSRTITLYKSSQRSLSQEVLSKQVRYALDRALGGNRGRVWEAKGVVSGAGDPQAGEHLYQAVLKFKREGRAISEAQEDRQFEKIKHIVERAVRGKGWSLNGDSPSRKQLTLCPKCGGRVNWQGFCESCDEHIGIEPKTKEEQNYAPIQPMAIKSGVDRHDYFGHLYNLDAQIDLVLSAVEEYKRSEFSNRFHCVLYGEPACGKTEILRSLTKMLGQDAVMHFDATSTTAAGAKQLLIESASIPPVLCIEEIEKADEVSLRWLLGVLDYRAEVRMVKFRSGLAQREVKLLCLATVNDLPLFKRMMDGALASRFSHKIYCPRPGREVLRRILEREIACHGGDARWIEPALDYCLDVEGTNDPRRVITVCLCGRERLLDGTYQRTLKATAAPKSDLSDTANLS